MQDQFKLRQVKQIPDSLFMEKDGKLKRSDMYSAKFFDSQNAGGERKHTLLSKVIKSCLLLQYSNANVERKISDNKNTFRLEISSLSDERLMRLRRIKGHTRKCAGVENVNTLDKGIIKEM